MKFKERQNSTTVLRNADAGGRSIRKSQEVVTIKLPVETRALGVFSSRPRGDNRNTCLRLIELLYICVWKLFCICVIFILEKAKKMRDPMKTPLF